MSTARPILASDSEPRRFRTLYELLAALSQTRSLEGVYEAALNSLTRATDANRAAILLIDDDGVMRFKASHGLSREYQMAVTGHSPWKAGTMDARPFCVADVREDESLKPFAAALRGEGICALAFVPLALEAGVFGKFMLYYPRPHQCSAEELEVASAIAAHVALATERKRAELERNRSERRLRAILDNSAAVIFLKDLEGRYLLVNRKHEELFGVARLDIAGRTDAEVFPKEAADRFRANDRAVLETGVAMSFEEYAPHEDGPHAYLSLKFPLREEDGRISGVCGIATDITERKKLEAASRHLAAIVESSEQAIISKDLNGAITSWNKAAERMFGYTAEEAMGRPVSMLATPECIEDMTNILARIRVGQRVEHFETRRKHKDGTILDVALTVSPVRDNAGQIVGASKIVMDITERKRSEREHTELLTREREARRTAELLNRAGMNLAAELDQEKLVQEVTDIATALVGADFGSFFHNVVNEKGESYMLYTLSGVSKEAFAGFPMPRNTEVFAPTFEGRGIVRSGDIRKDPRYGKNAPHHGMPKGHLPVCSYLAAPVISRSGEVLGGLFFGHAQPDRFTEMHEGILAGLAAQAAVAMDNARLFDQGQWVQKELKRSNEELRRANRDLEVFAYSASHDLKEPLRNIAISAQVLQRNVGEELSEENLGFLSNILTASRRMGTLMEDLLAYTKAMKYEEGPPPSVDANAVLAGVLESLRVSIEDAGAVLTTGNLPEVAIHESRLAQLFQNLISNSIRYRSKEAPCVHVAAVEKDGWNVFSVSDNGIGIEPKYAEQIFGLFKRLHGREEYPGSGVGLAICERVLEQYGGRIWMEKSEPGRGSTFSFSLPARAH